MNDFKEILLGILDLTFINSNILYFFLIFTLILLSILFNSFIANILVNKIKKLVKKTSNQIDDDLFKILLPPARILPIVLIFFLITLNFDKNSNIGFYLLKINTTLATIFIFWFMYCLLTPFSFLFLKLEKTLSKALVSWIIQSIKYLILFLGLTALLENWGIKVGPIIAGLGLLGVAVALGAQDLFKNLISGIMIIIEKRFQIGDVIKVPGHTEGTVEEIGFRSTLIKKFDLTPITIPNHIFAEAPILNYSKRTNRRINWTIGLEYSSDTKQIHNFINNLSEYIKNNNDFIANDFLKCYVRLDKFNDSSIDILIYCFTSTNDWEEYLIIKEKLALKIKDVVQKLNLGFAYPSQSIYLENFNKENFK